MLASFFVDRIPASVLGYSEVRMLDLINGVAAG